MVTKRCPPMISLVPASTKGSTESINERGGVQVIEFYKSNTEKLGLGLTSGPNGSVTISYIQPGSAAGKALLRIGDKVLTVNGSAVQDLDNARTVFAESSGRIIVCINRPMVREGHPAAHNAAPKPTPTPKPQTPPATVEEEVSFPSDRDITNVQRTKVILLERGSVGLGFTIVGGYGTPHGDIPIYVKSVSEVGAAAKCLKRGDQILAVNDVSLKHVSHDAAVSILKKSKGVVKLTVLPSA